jgi:hypothetical protein
VEIWDWRLAETMHAARAFEQADEFDLIHSHAYHFALPFTRLVRTPVVTTYHVEMDEDVVAAFAKYPEARVVAVSDCQRAALAPLEAVSVIPHGIDTDASPSRPTPATTCSSLGA